VRVFLLRLTPSTVGAQHRCATARQGVQNCRRLSHVAAQHTAPAFRRRERLAPTFNAWCSMGFKPSGTGLKHSPTPCELETSHAPLPKRHPARPARNDRLAKCAKYALRRRMGFPQAFLGIKARPPANSPAGPTSRTGVFLGKVKRFATSGGRTGLTGVFEVPNPERAERLRSIQPHATVVFPYHFH
jgi:hypothetical protein